MRVDIANNTRITFFLPFQPTSGLRRHESTIVSSFDRHVANKGLNGPKQSEHFFLIGRGVYSYWRVDVGTFVYVLRRLIPSNHSPARRLFIFYFFYGFHFNTALHWQQQIIPILDGYDLEDNGWTEWMDDSLRWIPRFTISFYLFSCVSCVSCVASYRPVAYDNMQLVPGTRRSGYRTMSHTATLLTVQN